MNEQEIIRRNETRRHIGKEARIEFELRKAIRDNKQVIIRRYRSSNSNEISDRRVEPYALVCNNESVMCYDLDKQAVRQFKMSRMADVTVLDCECKHICEHNEKRTDVFEWTYTGKCYHIMLSMSLKAMSHLCERHKGAKQYFCRCSDNEWVLNAHVYSLEPITGFYLSMAKEVSIIETEDYEVFRSYVSEYVDKYVLNCA
jgi:predicted DNA-binding transcriptional regulator YafY